MIRPNSREVNFDGFVAASITWDSPRLLSCRIFVAGPADSGAECQCRRVYRTAGNARPGDVEGKVFELSWRHAGRPERTAAGWRRFHLDLVFPAPAGTRRQDPPHDAERPDGKA